jgi:hypothetical protein
MFGNWENFGFFLRLNLTNFAIFGEEFCKFSISQNSGEKKKKKEPPYKRRRKNGDYLRIFSQI